jgi:tripartite-type tricarboxylate transporter receptor subunit TctC
VPATAPAQSVENFYRARQVTLLIGGGAGGGYDVYFRAFARYFGKHIPGQPSIVTKIRARGCRYALQHRRSRRRYARGFSKQRADGAVVRESGGAL